MRFRLLNQIRSVHVYSRKENKWERCPELPDCEPNGSSCFLNNMLYYIYTSGRRLSMHQITMRLMIKSSRPYW